MLRRIVLWLSDYLFPVFCVDCGGEGDWFCKKCKRRNKIRPFIFYPPDSPINKGVFAFFPYTHESVWGKLIRLWKYNFVTIIKNEWQDCIANVRLFFGQYLNGFDRTRIVYLVPVPLHSRRLRERGFNQAKELAEILLENFLNSGFKVEILDCLERVRYTSQQAKLSPKERQKNLDSAFVWKTKNIIPNQIILVDDVFTTGFTMRECALVLAANGARKVGAIVLAHG